MRALGVILALGALAALAAPALADDADVDADSAITSHKGQVGVSARLGVGVRAIATYERDVFCGADVDDRVCTGRSPMSLDLEAAYGIKDSIELTLELRIGLES